jgi:hypothetical protein
MRAIIIKQDDRLQARVTDQLNGNPIMDFDEESVDKINLCQLTDEMEGYVIRDLGTVPDSNIKYSRWRFHIDFFTEG